MYSRDYVYGKGTYVPDIDPEVIDYRISILENNLFLMAMGTPEVDRINAINKEIKLLRSLNAKQ